MGLPCVQPYKRLSNKDIITTVLQNLTVVSNLDDQPVNKNKQNTAFPPNFVHSIDSTHMMYTALRWRENGITFAAVHDSYWCHPKNVELMAKLLRDQFVNLHSEPLLENLKENFSQRYPHNEFPEVPKRGSFDLNEIKDSSYFFA